MKKYGWFTALAALILALGSLATAQAAIIPPGGEGQIGIGAVVMLNQLPLYEAPSESSKVMGVLHTGNIIIVVSQKDGWAECVLSDAEDAGPRVWAKAEYLCLDPGFFMTEEATPVYAWNDTAAPRIDQVEEFTLLPLLKQDGEWLVVCLQGGTGWIHYTQAE